MADFDESLINLDECVVSALELFIKKGLPKLDLGNYKRLLVVGSGNAIVTGKILFEDKDAVFADESSYLKKLEAVEVDAAFLISASGGKHAPIIAKELKKRKIKTFLLTNNPDAPAKAVVDKTFVFPKNVQVLVKCKKVFPQFDYKIGRLGVPPKIGDENTLMRPIGSAAQTSAKFLW